MERDEQDSGQEFRREAFERSAGYGSRVTRRLISEGVSNPSERETRELLELITSDILNPVLEEHASSDTLKAFKEIDSKRYDYPLSAPHLSSLFISHIAGVLLGRTIEDFKNKELSSIPILSICLYDVGSGISGVASTIQDAENAIRGTFDNELGSLISESPAGAISLSDQADFFLKEKAKALKYSKLLKEDHTGRSLVRHAVEEIENPKYEHGPCLREFAVYGARFAEKVYGIVYPLAEKINKPT